MAEIKSISVAEAKRTFADVLGAVRYHGERFVVERNGTPMAALVPISDLPRTEQSPAAGLLGLVGSFTDAPEYADELQRAVSARHTQRSRRAPMLQE